ncbi:MAG: FKBP-type peptidyl-prolyl cis-trans isomerase [Candidatus Iainarchaeum sp.]|nr:MAG: putative FKBP-type peptidyl-prolyl cis-trans isomerase [archaeon ADurb.Bin336]
MVEKKRKIVKINFVGKEALEGKVFDTTNEQEAKKAGIYDERRKYEPLTIITGEKELLEKVEDVIEQMNEGEKQLVKLLSNEAFGERKQELVRVIPIKNFHDQKINPFPGLVVRVANAIGKVQSVTSGRVRIDFNHPLAGRDVEYYVELVREIKDNNEIAEAIYEKYYEKIPGAKKKIESGVLIVTLSKNLMKNLEEINKSIAGIAKEFGVELKFKEEDMVGKEVELPKELNESKKPSKEKESSPTEKPKSINKIADEAKQQTKKFDVSRDSSTTIQRPKK